MNQSLVFSFIGPDQPGLVEKIAATVSRNDGNWLESRMTQLAGQFAGIVRVDVARDKAATLASALEALGDGALTVTLQREPGTALSQRQQTQRLSLIGNDRPGIVSEVTRALAARRINVCEMSTNIVSAPMTGDPLFEACADIELPASVALSELQQQLDAIADQLGIDIVIE